MKTRDILLLGAAGFAGYYLLARPAEDDTGAQGGGSTILDLGGLLDPLAGIVSGGMPSGTPEVGDISGAIAKLLAGAQAQADALLGGATAQVGDMLGGTQGIIDALLAGAQAQAEAILSEAQARAAALLENGTPPPEEPTPKSDTTGADSEGDIDGMSEWERAMRQKAATEATAVGGLYAGGKMIPWWLNILGKVAPSVAGKAAPRAIGAAAHFLGPVGVAYTVVDALATVYEGVSGQNIAGGWLGWGELLGQTSWGRAIGFENSEVPTPQGQPGYDPDIVIKSPSPGGSLIGSGVGPASTAPEGPYRGISGSYGIATGLITAGAQRVAKAPAVYDMEATRRRVAAVTEKWRGVRW